MTARHLQIKSIFILSIMVFLPVLACSIPGFGPGNQDESNQGVIYTQAAQTFQAELTDQAPPFTQTVAPPQPVTDTPVPVEPTETPPEPTQTFTLSPTLAATALPENTAIPEMITISATVNTNCRSGPSPLFDPPVGALAVGQEAEVHGRLADNSWWLISNPSRPGTLCWVWGETTVVNGSVTAVLVVTPPPFPPTPTFTATPGINFVLAYVKVRSCGGVPTAIFSVQNNGYSDLDSLNLKINDLTDSDTLFGPASSNAPFMSTADECPPGGDLLPKGKTYYIGGAIGSGNAGHSARATVKLCSENDLDGLCLERSIEFTIP